MAGRSLHRLSDRGVKAAKPGMHCDGGGLYLQATVGVDGSTRKSWLFRFATGEIKTSRTGKARRVERAMGLGSFPDTSLAVARERAAVARKQHEQGQDPIGERRTLKAAAQLASAKAMTFDECAKAYIEAHEASWKNAKHRQQWTNTLKTYVSPVFGKLPVQAVDVGLVMKVIQPIWSKKPETASRVRGRIEVILDWAKVSGYRTGENPARWRGHTDNLLPAKSTVRKVVHHAALPYREVGAFLVDLRQREGVAARALEFTILCATRTGDVIGNDRDDKPPMRRSHVNFRDRVWTIPSTKTGAEHRVPLSTAAMALLAKMGDGEADDLMFPGMAGEPLSNASMASVIERMNDDRTARGLARYVDRKQGNRDVTVHGFRSTFEDWALDTTSFPEIVTDMALAHKIDDKVKAAYLRSDLFEKRRRLMVQWATFCNKSKSVTRGKVVPLRRA